MEEQATPQPQKIVFKGALAHAVRYDSIFFLSGVIVMSIFICGTSPSWLTLFVYIYCFCTMVPFYILSTIADHFSNRVTFDDQKQVIKKFGARKIPFSKVRAISIDITGRQMYLFLQSGRLFELFPFARVPIGERDRFLAEFSRRFPNATVVFKRSFFKVLLHSEWVELREGSEEKTVGKGC